jgi:hypothetical protein
MVYVIQVCRRFRAVAGSGWNSVCMTYTIAECTVSNSWWWTEEMSETCRVSFQNKFQKLVHLVGFIIRIFHDARSHVTMHGHMSRCTVTCHDARSRERKSHSKFLSSFPFTIFPTAHLLAVYSFFFTKLYTLSPTYLYHKDERTLLGIFRSRKFPAPRR